MTQPPPSVKPPPTSRASLRKILLDQRRDTETTLRQQWDKQITERLVDWCRQTHPASLGVFWPIQAEPDLRSCYPQLHEMGIQLALPVVINKAEPLIFLQWTPGDLMCQDDYGIPVPAQRERVIQPLALVIPCVGFNADRYRLGYGGGYYDRTLAMLPRPLAIGIAYRQGQSEFAAEAHDVAMDHIFTES
jgi:5-formyltetrahydrofolate cyclo-ligase